MFTWDDVGKLQIFVWVLYIDQHDVAAGVVALLPLLTAFIATLRWLFIPGRDASACLFPGLCSCGSMRHGPACDTSLVTWATAMHLPLRLNASLKATR